MPARFARPATAAILLSLTLLSPIRADNLDVGLMKEIYSVNNYLSNHDVKNVGVLNFRVQKGSAKESFSLGTLCTGMPLRVETALVVTDPKESKKTRGIIHDANSVAAGYKIDWYSHPAERPNLFARFYPMPWGSVKVKPDAMLTGLIKVDKDLAKLHVRIEAMLVADPKKLDTVCEFTVDNDRDLLRELGQSYAVTSRSLGKTVAERNKAAVANAHKRDLSSGDDLTPDNISGIKFEVLYDGNPQAIRKDENSPGEWRVDPPQAGQAVCLRLQHNGTKNEKLGASVRVNGRSVWNQMEGPIDASTGVWIFEPGQLPTEFKGFLTDVKGTNLIPFRVLTEEESLAREAEFGERVGTFDVDVLGSSPTPEPDREVLSISRGLSRSLKPSASKPKTQKDYVDEVLKKNALLKKAAVSEVITRGLIDAGDQAIEGPVVQSAELPDRKPLGRLTVRYYDKKSSASSEVVP